MGRLIDRDELLTAFPVDDEPMLTKSCVRMTIQRMPTVDAVPVVHGRWINEGVYGEGHSQCSIRCSNPLCNFHYIGYLDEYNYCPNCGAKMEEIE